MEYLSIENISLAAVVLVVAYLVYRDFVKTGRVDVDKAVDRTEELVEEVTETVDQVTDTADQVADQVEDLVERVKTRLKPAKELEGMTKANLAEYAQTEFGIELRTSKTKAEMIKDLKAQHRTL